KEAAAGLAGGAPRLAARGPPDRLDAGVVEALGLGRVTADDREDLLVGIRRRERALDRRVVDPHGRKPTHARRYRALDHLAVGRLAVVEMAVAVDHGTAAAPGSGELRLRSLHPREERLELLHARAAADVPEDRG